MVTAEAGVHPEIYLGGSVPADEPEHKRSTATRQHVTISMESLCILKNNWKV